MGTNATWQYGLRMERQFWRAQTTGSYSTVGTGRVCDSRRGEKRQARGRTTLAASTRVAGQTFQLKRMPSTSSVFSMNSCRVAMVVVASGGQIEMLLMEKKLRWWRW